MKQKVDQYTKMTETPIAKLVINLSIPTIISMLVTNIYNLVDTAFVGTLGTSASGAVGIVFGFMSILQAIGFMFGQGCGSLLSRKLGQKDIDRATVYASTGFFGSFGFGVIAAIICFIFIDPLCMLMGSTPTILPYARSYVIFILIAAPFVASSFTLNNILRYEGRAVLGMVGLMTGAIINIVGDAVLIFGLKMGIAGAGLSTALSQIVSFSILISMFVRKKTQCAISIKGVAIKDTIVNIMLTGFPSMLRQGLSAVATVILNSQAKLYGDAAIAGMSNCSRVAFFVFSIALGIGQGFQPISAFNYGAKKFARVRKAYWTTILMAEAISVMLVLAVVFNASEVIALLRNDPEVIEIGSRALVLQLLAQLPLPFCMVTEMLFQSTGRKKGAIFLSASRSGLIFIPAIYIMSYLRGLAGIQEAQPLSFIISIIPAAICAVSFFRKLPKNNLN